MLPPVSVTVENVSRFNAASNSATTRSAKPALSMFEKAVALDPNFTEARMNVGNISYNFV